MYHMHPPSIHPLLVHPPQIFSESIVLLVSTSINLCEMGSPLSSKFHVTNGVRQGGVTSPLLFNVYVNELSELLNKSGIGGNMGGTIISHMLYADDICIVSLSSSGLQQLLNICHDYCELHGLTFNAKQYMCMYFSIDINKHCGLSVICLGNCVCLFVKGVKYLGVMIILL